MPQSNMLQEYFGLGKLAHSRKSKMKAEYFILTALGKDWTAQLLYRKPFSGSKWWKLGMKSSIQETTTWYYPNVSMSR